TLMPEQEREAMDVFIRGLRPYEFQAKVRREVDACREAKMWGVGPTADAGPASESLSALMKFVVHQVEKASKSLNEWHRTMGVKHHASVVRSQTPFVSSKPRYTSNGHLEHQPPPKPIQSAVKEQVYTPMELKPRCVFCGRANHWCWMCKDQAGKGRGLTPQFEKFQKMCVAADGYAKKGTPPNTEEFRPRASVGQSTTPQQSQSSSQPHASQSSGYRPYQPRDMSRVE
ncbi:hypothetical protein ADUPG1_002279, partial [Aduncisulcus paluster]